MHFAANLNKYTSKKNAFAHRKIVSHVRQRER